MIIKVSTLKSADVLTREGEKFDSIKEILYDPSKKTIAGFLTAKKSMMSEAQAFPFTSVQKFSQQAIMIDSKDSIKIVTELGAPFPELSQDEGMMLKKGTVLDENVQKYGSISDVFFDTDTAQIKGFEISNGPLQDVKEGKKTMEISQIISVGRYAVIVKPVFPSQSSLQQKIASLPGDMMKTFSYTAQKAAQIIQENTTPQSHKQQSRPRPYSFRHHPDFQQSKARTQSQPQSGQRLSLFTQELSKDPDPKQVQDVIGKYVAKNILTSSDYVLAQRGQIITHQLMQNAYIAGVVDEVLANTSSTPL